MPDSVTIDPKSVDFTMVRRLDYLYTLLGASAYAHSQFAAYPVLLPIYLMRYDLPIPAVSETIPFTCMVQAHSEDVREISLLIYMFAPTIFTGFDIYRYRGDESRWPSSGNAICTARFTIAQVLAHHGRYSYLGSTWHIVWVL